MSSMFSGIGDWLRTPMAGGAPGGMPGAAPGGMPGAAPGGMTRGMALGNALGSVGKSISGGGTVASGLASANNAMQQQQSQQGGNREEELWAMLQKLVAQRGLPGQGGAGAMGPGGGALGARISGPPGQAPGMGAVAGGLY